MNREDGRIFFIGRNCYLELTNGDDVAILKRENQIGLKALQGEPITELMRWEKDEWEMFAGPGPEVQKEDTRVVSLGTILGIDNTLLPAVDLETGKGLWRTDRDSEWQNWEQSDTFNFRNR